MSRKGENIFFRKDGRWEARYIKEEIGNKKYKYGYVYGKTYTDVKQKRNKILLNLEKIKEEERKNKYQFNYYIQNWLNSIKFLVKTSTYVHYLGIVKNHIQPLLGELELCEINTEKIEFFINQKFEEAFSNKTIRDMIVVLKQILSYANLSIKVKMPKLKKNEIKILSKSDQKRLEKEILKRDTTIGYGILLSLYTGLRIGEVCALKWNDINLTKRIIKVKHTMLRVMDIENFSKTKIILEEPKTENSKREIPINKFLYEILLKIKPKDGNAYFLTGTTSYIEPRTYYNKFQKLLEETNIKKYGFHTLRHTFATRCIEVGMDPKTLSEILGHSDVKVTLSLYVHPTNFLKAAYMEKLSN